MFDGKIIKGVGGNYYVDTELGLIECRARGLFRNKNISPMVGDNVTIRVTKENNKQGYIESIYDRINEMKRPPVSNVDQIIIVFAIKNPEPSFLLLDKLLVLSEFNNLMPIICFNKSDLTTDEYNNEVYSKYMNTGYKVIFTSKYDQNSINGVKNILKDKITLFAGPSGVGKSSLMNAIGENLDLKTGEISNKLKRGKHTTRHAEMYKLSYGGFVVDTPGFSSLDINEIRPNELTNYFPDLLQYSGQCKFNNCIHNKEPGCKIKKAVKEKLISESRYQNYIRLLEELNKVKLY